MLILEHQQTILLSASLTISTAVHASFYI